MIKLLNASFTRLKKNTLFWLLTIFSVGFAILVIIAQYNQMLKYNSIIEVEQLVVNYSIFIGLIIAIFTSLFLGTEYSDGALRNKIIIGHKRSNIYLANLLIITAVSLFSYILFMLITLIIGIPLFDGFTMKLSSFFIQLGCIFIVIIVYANLFTFIAMIISNKTITAVVCIMSAFAMMMIALSCLNILATQKYITSVTMVDGEMVTDVILNPKYPSEAKKKFYQTLLDINPTGQMYQLAGRSATNLKALPLYSLGIIVIFTSSGLILFKKKEVK